MSPNKHQTVMISKKFIVLSSYHFCLSKVLIFVFNLLHGKTKSLEEAIEETKPLMQLVFYCLDKVKRYKLSREAKVIILPYLLDLNK